MSCKFLWLSLSYCFWGGLKVSEKIKKTHKGISEENLNKLLEMLKIVKYGSITLVIQDGMVVQIERNEKVRLV
ncbi:YezD family protein [Clostridium sp. DJ247]|nr:YezD family protein [Clostridium sp. DJ247]